MSNDSTLKTFLVAFLLCVVCSVLVCLAALVRIDREAYNKQLEIRKNVLAADGYEVGNMSGDEIDKLFLDNMELKIVDLDTGEFTDAVDPKTYDQRAALEDPELRVKIPAEYDIAGMGTRAKYAAIYVTKDGDMVLPIWGAGMWGQMHGYIALKKDGTTVKGFTFYEHSETPGLGAEVDNPRWKAQWPGKQIYDKSGKLAIKVVKNGKYNPDAPDANSTIDGLAGASVTSGHVKDIVRYWFGEHGYGKFLANLKAKRG